MKKVFLAVFVLVIGLLTPMISAEIAGVAGGNSSAGTAPAIIGAPANVLEDTVTNRGMQGFNEAKVVTTIAHNVNGGVIPAGMLVSSHMIFLNSRGRVELNHANVVWTLSQSILGVMSDPNGEFEAASSFELGAPATNYTVTFPGSGPAAPYRLRGLETIKTIDSYIVSGNQITVTMNVVEPGDWIRVVTCAQGSQGFWKNHPDAWPVSAITIGGQEYTKAEAIALMKSPVRRDKTLTMFRQLVAAKLNVMTAGNECLPDCIGGTIEAADAWLTENPVGNPGVRARSEEWRAGEPLYEVLDTYNNEELTCPD